MNPRMEKAWGMNKCVGFDKTGACHFFFWEKWGISKWFNAEENTDFLRKSLSVCFFSGSSTHGLGSSLVLVRLQLKCARGMVAAGGGCTSPAPCTLSRRHTGLFPKATKRPSPGAGSPTRTSERSNRFRTYAYTTLIYALVVPFMPVSRMLYLTQWGKWCMKQQQNKQTNKPDAYNWRAEFWLKGRREGCELTSLQLGLITRGAAALKEQSLWLEG